MSWGVCSNNGRKNLLFLVQLVKQCLHNVPEERPITEEVLERLQRIKTEVEGVYGGSFVKLDISRVLLAKEMKMKDRKLKEMAVHSYIS